MPQSESVKAILKHILSDLLRETPGCVNYENPDIFLLLLTVLLVEL